MARCAHDIAACVQALHPLLLSASTGWTECHSEGFVLRHQARLLGRVLDPTHDQHGYSAAQWCALYSSSALVPMRGACVGQCSSDNDVCGWPAAENASRAGVVSPMFGLQPCVCASLHRQFGWPPLNGSATMDLHPWGVYLAERTLAKARIHQRAPTWAELSNVLEQIKRHMISPVDEEPMHGYLWRMLATNATLSGITHPAHFAHKACSLFHDGKCREACYECGHGVGHGLFYRDLDIHTAIDKCLTMGHAAQSGEQGSHVLNDANWKRGCASGAFHSWFNSMTFPDQVSFHLPASCAYSVPILRLGPRPALARPPTHMRNTA
jgi:hypothetical protein